MRIAVVLSMLLAGAASAADPKEPEKKPRLVVNDLTPLRVSPEEAQAITDAVVTYLSGRGLFEVLGTRDVQALLGAERQRQLAGACELDASGCSVDLSTLLSARFVLSGQLAKVGSAYQLTLQLADTERSQAAGRSSKLAGTLEAMRDLVPYAASEATGSPLPPPPSRALPITLIGAGGATLLSGGVVGLLALSREAQLNAELCPGGTPEGSRCDGVGLRARSFYEEQQRQLVGQKALGLGLMAAGAALLAVGVVVMPPDDARTRISARVLPMANGVVLVGGF